MTLTRIQFTRLHTAATLITMLLPALGSYAAATPAEQADADRGKLLFERRCTGCHSLDLDKEGPHLRGVYGRKSGSITTFSYSTALKSSQITWDDATLERWLTNTSSVIPGNDMDFRVPNPQERADIIRYLRVASGK